MEPSAAGAQQLRRLTRRYPLLRGTGLLSSIVEKLRAPRRTPQAGGATGDWALVPRANTHPAFALDLRDPWQRRVFYFTPSYGRLYLDAKVRWLLEAYLHPGAIFLDIGANLGFFALEAARLVAPRGIVYAFEPQPATFASLERSAQLVEGAVVRCLPIALSNAAHESMRFFLSRDFTSSSLRPEAPERARRYAGEIRVRTESLDRLVAGGEIPLSRIDLAKIDVEGAEASVIEGMVATLSKTGLPPLFVEVRGPSGSTRAPDTYRQVLALLDPLGYRVFRVAAPADLRPVSLEDVNGRETLLFRCREPRGA